MIEINIIVFFSVVQSSQEQNKVFIYLFILLNLDISASYYNLNVWFCHTTKLGILVLSFQVNFSKHSTEGS